MMTLDKLLSWIHDRYMYHAADDSGDARDSAAAGAYSKVKKYIEDNRDDLEAGTRGMQRFQSGMPINKQGIWYLCAEHEGKCSITNKIKRHPIIDSRYSFFSKQDCEAFAQSLGLTAEFVEDKQDEN